MAHYRIACGACGHEFDVDAGASTARCSSCGTEHAGPWDRPTVTDDGAAFADALGYEARDPRVIMEPAAPTPGGRA